LKRLKTQCEIFQRAGWRLFWGPSHPPENQSATVYSPDGEQIAHYNSGNIGGWINLTTRAENQFLGDFNDAYKQARDVARAEMNAPKTSAQSSTFSESTVDFRA
jgi:hypothetical protein